MPRLHALPCCLRRLDFAGRRPAHPCDYQGKTILSIMTRLEAYGEKPENLKNP